MPEPDACTLACARMRLQPLATFAFETNGDDTWMVRVVETLNAPPLISHHVPYVELLRMLP